ncbi:MAG: 2,3-bisphosphoglycerate-independent phosphoglycerate mutase [Lewinellaceae bacterium]|nr:2,3-bisphosphoglycerate-independent phosphoglycerate mutase [Lewinellaceae bacterium]
MLAHSRAFLLILDGWGLGTKPEADAIRQADTPFMDSLLQHYPHSTLVTYGEDVGLPEGQMGNSEVGHLNIGAGRVVWQELARINKAVREGALRTILPLKQAFAYARAVRTKVHLIGLVSDGGVHSHINHLKALCDIAHEMEGREVYIHAFTDGRDCDPKSGAAFIEELLKYIAEKGYTNIQLASVIGRYYAMDRDKRWERVKLAYDLLVHGIGEGVSNFPEAIRNSYAAGVTDEFIKPLVCLGPDGKPLTTIETGNVVICFNFRTDRLRELTTVLTQKDMPEFGMHTFHLHYVTMTRYDESFKNIFVLFDKDNVEMTLGEVIADADLTQVRIAETEKYPHVTFFFSGGAEEPFEGERRIMIPSPKVATYDLQPEMSALELTEAILQDIQENKPDFICLNFANTDMVGHTGVFSAAIKAAETVDHCLSRIVPLAEENGYACLLIADHGNSDYLINDDGTPNTAHTMNPVPCILVSKYLKNTVKLNHGRLADVAPTLLELMGVEKPKQMTGVSLIAKP